MRLTLRLVLLAVVNVVAYYALYSATNFFLKIFSGIVIGELAAMLFIAVLDWKFVFILFAANLALLSWAIRERIARFYGNNRKLRKLARYSFMLPCGLYIFKVISVLSACLSGDEHFFHMNKFGFYVDETDKDFIYTHETIPSVPPMHVQLNSFGYRDDEWDLKAPVRRALLAGDSFVWGVGIREKSGTIDAFIESSLNADPSKPRWDVLNLGLKPSGIGYYIEVLKSGAKIVQPDVVIMSYLGLIDGYLVDEQVLLSRQTRFVAAMLKSFGVIRDVQICNALSMPRRVKHWLVLDWERGRLRKAFRKFLEFLEREKIPLIVWEHLQNDPLFDPFRGNSMVTFLNWRDTGLKMKIESEEPLDEWLSVEGYHVPGDIHPSELTNREIAKVIASAVLKATGDKSNVKSGVYSAGTDSIGVSHVDTKSLTPGFVRINAGSFWMGSPSGGLCPAGYTGGGCKGHRVEFSTEEPSRNDDETLHYVKLTRDFEMKAHEVTQDEFEERMGYNPSSNKGCGRCPVERVSWHEALAFANAVSNAAGLEACFDCTGTPPYFNCSLKVKFAKPQDCPGYRLPTESEWEYAYRAGSLTAFYPVEGSDGSITVPDNCVELDLKADKIAWYCGNAKTPYTGLMDSDGSMPFVETVPHPVGGKAPNAWGLYDMAGNVWEWCWDGYASYPEGNLESPAIDPVGVGANKVERGGSGNYVAKYLRAAYRDSNGNPENRFNFLGFRIVRTLP